MPQNRQSDPAAALLRADVCVVGAGPAGLTLAHQLGRAGLEVLLIEAGPADPPDGGLDVDSTRNVGLPYAPGATRSAGLGGSSLRWSVETPLGGGFVRLKELDDTDFAGRDYVTASPWPFGRAVLEPWYRQARELIGLVPDPEADGEAAGGLERRTFSFVHRSVFTRELPRLVRSDPRVRLVAGCSVTEVVTGTTGGDVLRLRAFSEEDGEVVVEARAYILAGGALENARLLLASRSVLPEGVGNRHDHVGRHFMEHPHYVSGVVLPDRGGKDLASTAATWDVVVRDGRPRQAKYVLPQDVRQREGLLAAVYKVAGYRRSGPTGFGHDGHVPQRAVDAYAAARSAVRSRDLRGVTAADGGHLLLAAPDLLRHALNRSAGRVPGRAPAGGVLGHRVMVMGEQEPSPDSRLRLAAPLDRFGMPTAELDWRLTPLDVRSMVRGQRLAAEGLGNVVGGRVITTLGPDGVPAPHGGAHHMGTTRMSMVASDGVVDPSCRVHGLRNLYVAGSSVFPTAGAANPTLTILALALRLAAHLVVELAPTVLRQADGSPAVDGGASFTTA